MHFQQQQQADGIVRYLTDVQGRGNIYWNMKTLTFTDKMSVVKAFIFLQTALLTGSLCGSAEHFVPHTSYCY